MSYIANRRVYHCPDSFGLVLRLASPTTYTPTIPTTATTPITPITQTADERDADAGVDAGVDMEVDIVDTDTVDVINTHIGDIGDKCPISLPLLCVCAYGKDDQQWARSNTDPVVQIVYSGDSRPCPSITALGTIRPGGVPYTPTPNPYPNNPNNPNPTSLPLPGGVPYNPNPNPYPDNPNPYPNNPNPNPTSLPLPLASYSSSVVAAEDTNTNKEAEAENTSMNVSVCASDGSNYNTMMNENGNGNSKVKGNGDINNNNNNNNKNNNNNNNNNKPRVNTILIHEATFDDDKPEEAIAKRHSTISEALDMGLKMGAVRT